VALRARDTRVGAAQREVRDAVIERLAVEPHDVRVAPAVLGVAGAAIAAARGRRPPMEAPLRAQVGGDLVVTHETQPLLGAALEGLVAFAALRLDVRVRSGDGSRHHEPFERLGGRGDTHGE
jgi:hypothetical protein